MEAELQTMPPSDTEPRSSALATRSAPPIERREPDQLVRPALDVLESDEALRVLVDLPGVALEDVSLQLAMPHLRIDARRSRPDGSQLAYHAALRVPGTVDPDGTTAELRRGVLEVTLSKTTAARARNVEIRTS